MIIQVDITKDMLEEAEHMTAENKAMFGIGCTHRKDFKRQKLTGFLAEVAINRSFPDLSYSDKLAVDFKYKGYTFDSKAQGCNSKPLNYYNATLYEEKKKRDTDFYIFNRVKNDSSCVWICGIISKQRFFNIAKLKKAGTKCNNFTYNQSRYEIQYEDLTDLREALNLLKSNKTEE